MLTQMDRCIIDFQEEFTIHDIFLCRFQTVTRIKILVMEIKVNKWNEQLENVKLSLKHCANTRR